LTEDEKSRLEAGFTEFEKLVESRGDLMTFIAQRVDRQKVSTAMMYMAEIKAARMRSAAKGKGFNIGV
jgi:predicted secreted acid phosphatase